jgi:hypothetical protein
MYNQPFASVLRAAKMAYGMEIANIHAACAHVAEKMVGCQKRLGAHPLLSARKFLQGFMILHTVEQVRRVFLIIAGFTLLLAGVVMLLTPGPGVR